MEDRSAENIEPVMLDTKHRLHHKQVSLAGVVPYIVHGPDPRSWEVMVMQPSDEDGALFEISKGKRRWQNEDGKLVDIRKGEDVSHVPGERLKTLWHEALREGREEIGLRDGNIVSVIDTGDYQADLSQVRPGKPLSGPIRVFAVKVKDKNDFAEPKHDAKTLEAKWMSVQEFIEQGRLDHSGFAEEIGQRMLRAFYDRSLQVPELENPDRGYWQRG